MATVIITAKIMPNSIETDMKKIETAANAFLKFEGAKQIRFEEKPIAFGLKALIIKTDFPEEKGTDFVEKKLSEIEGVSSVIIEDYRRTLG